PNFRPRITVIVPTYNDAQTINEKLFNLIEQSYPTNLMEILMIDSASKDQTVDIVRRFMSDYPEVNMKFIVEEERRGKSAAINRALSNIDSQSEIVIMTDANAFLNKHAVQKVIARFSFPEVGAVVGRQMVHSTNQSSEARSERAYLSFYQKMRRGESSIDSTPIFDGELSAYRTRVIKGVRIRENLNADDSQLAIIVRRQGYKAVIEPEAIFYESLPSHRRALRIQKVRRGQGLARLFWYNKVVMFRRSYGKFGSTIFPANFFMHVISPFFVLGSILLAGVSILSLVLQTGTLFIPLILLSIVLITILGEQIVPTRTKVSNIALTFLEYQLILLEGIVRYLIGDSLHKWQKVQKTPNPA
ncbi:MAG: glycosyltransferase, partial [Candidatus Hodarchaeota archaeon]